MNKDNKKQAEDQAAEQIAQVLNKGIYSAIKGFFKAIWALIEYVIFH